MEKAALHDGIPIEIESLSKRGRQAVIREASSVELLVHCKGGFYVGEGVEVRLLCDAVGGDPRVACTVVRTWSSPDALGYRHRAILRIEDPAFDRKYDLALARLMGRFDQRLAS